MFKLAFICFVAPLFLLFTNTSSSHNTSSSTNCPTYHCKNGPNISYPFWLSQGSPPDQYCGYPEFGLICSDHGDPIFSPPPGYYYYVKNVDYGKHSLNLVDFDTANQTCPRALHKVPLGNLPLSQSSLNLNLGFYYNCTSYPSGVPSIKCLSFGVKESFVFVMGNETKGFDWLENCEANVMVTVMKDQITSDNGLMHQFAGAISEGFVLEWRTSSNCVECEASNGLCGYSNTRKEVLCFCNDGTTRSNKCDGGSSTGLSRLIIDPSCQGLFSSWRNWGTADMHPTLHF
ncbi:LEAF RUST 10 DISEASE-RESISTANCE LOCUS RECEPTOR-LIKE PROTEIN KINASE-like 1.2 isoform X2 [Abrus precatorius]|uniref:non-specific serine/threonine protein kinase n=1 Tax=Abrus precatorius TaxID=3816 RepID=A0A8B8KIL6_ABRPR|nr:LEAF RUST 10 DISEASE-RESISTANCE LOCUS RECEPTOR-LIKE PROTEIN KINASE-like 1.2 isoform X2 [Abrus precatorius]